VADPGQSVRSVGRHAADSLKAMSPKEVPNMKRWILATALAAMALPAFAADKVPMSDVPKAAQETIRREAGKSKPIELKRTTKNNRTVYDVEWEESDGTNYEMRVREDGKILKKGTNFF
jgi:uncharacterized membrane protein YkoI